MTKINWKPFFDNRSTIDALYEFVFWKFSFKDAFNHTSWPPEVTSQFGKIKHMKVSDVRRRGRQAFRRWN